jgi:hypothetical protein
MMLALGDIQPHDEMILGSANLPLELTKRIDPGSLALVHGNLLLAQ